MNDLDFGDFSQQFLRRTYAIQLAPNGLFELRNQMAVILAGKANAGTQRTGTASAPTLVRTSWGGG